MKIYRPSPQLVALGVPADFLIGRYYVTTDADILLIGNVRVDLPIGQSLFQVPPPFGSNREPPPP